MPCSSLGLRDLGSKGRHKAATYNCIPQGIGRARHITPQTDSTVGLLRNMSCSSWVCVIRVVMERHKATTRNGVPQER